MVELECKYLGLPGGGAKIQISRRVLRLYVSMMLKSVPTSYILCRKANITEMLGCIRQDGLLNCMHALMAYLQTASVENQPPTAGLLLQLDLLLVYLVSYENQSLLMSRELKRLFKYMQVN